MSASMRAPDAESAERRLIGGSLQIEASLGEGGMGDVYRVLDTRSGRRLALKRCRSIGPESRRAIRDFQFEREYHTLCQLAHPRIIEVYDYGLDADGAYYTMELLDGEDLRECGRLPWRKACALLLDVASSLAIVHSRGFLHRDISPRNVRCTADGRAKLIDFGALMPMGKATQLVGTPPFIPPEALQLQSLDARADLYALGALAYWMLTGRNAYPARSINELRNLWIEPPVQVSRIQPDVPEALDRLVMQLLHANRNARPATAAEVMERLAGIAGLSLQERPEVTRAYLVTPPLIGREPLLAGLREHLAGALQGHGTCVIIEGAAGTGRSRFLDACVLEAKVLGAVVLRADGADGTPREYGIAEALCRQMLQALPRLAAQSAEAQRSVLAFIVAELGHGVAGPTPERHVLQGALSGWFEHVANSQRLVLAVDDAHAIDEPSAAWLATLAHPAERGSLSLLLTSNLAVAPSPALALVRRHALCVELRPFALHETAALIRAMFGVEQVATVADRIHQLAEGNPRWIMALVEWLVERGTARYEAGSWTLPLELRPGDLPESLTAALAARVAALGPEARELGEALSLADPTLFAVKDYEQLIEHEDPRRIHRALDALLAAGILVVTGERYKFRQAEFSELLAGSLGDERRRVLHGRIARALEHADRLVLLVHHKLLAGEERAAVECLFVPMHRDESLEFSLLTLSVVQRAVEAAERLAFPHLVQLELQLWLITLAAILGEYAVFVRIGVPLLEQLQRESGLADYRALDPELPASTRLVESLTQVQQRYDATPDLKRGFTPVESIRRLARLCSGFTNMGSIAQNLELIESLPSLEPLAPLSPALSVVQMLIDGMRAFQSGRYEAALNLYLRLLERIALPDSGGLEPMLHTAVRFGALYFQGVVATLRGVPSAANWLAELEQEPGHRVNAWRVHMAAELMQGNVEAAAECQRRAELTQVQDGHLIRYRGTTVRLELLAHARSNDLIGVKRAMERIEPVAASYPRWQVDLQLARFHYKRLQGDDQGALEMLLPALELVAPGRHINWALTVSSYVRALCAVGRHGEAVVHGFEYLATHEREGLSGTTCELTQSLAEALAGVGRLAEAAHFADRCVSEAEALGSRGVFLGTRHETRARIALAMGDATEFSNHARRCASEYRRGGSPALVAQYERLLRDAAQSSAARRLSAVQLEAALVTSRAEVALARVAACTQRPERVREALAALLELTGASAGYLFGLGRDHLQLLAAAGCAGEPSAALLAELERYLQKSLEPACDTTTATEASDVVKLSAWCDDLGRSLVPILLIAPHQGERVIAAIAAVHYSGQGRFVADPVQLEAITTALLRGHDVEPRTYTA